MDRNTSQPAGGTDRPSPQRGQVGYVSRQSSYYSSASPQLSPAAPTPQPSQIVTQASEAAQRIFEPKVPAPPAPKPFVSSASSFDMLVPKKPSLAPTAPQVAKPVAPEMTAWELPAPPTPAVRPAMPVFAQAPAETSLPTDLKQVFVAAPEAQSLKKHSKLALTLPKLSVPQVMVAMAVTLFITGAVISFLSFKTNKDVVAQVKSATSTQNETDDDGGMTSGIPDEQGGPPSVNYYRTAASYPRVIRIPKIETEARVLALAIAPTGALKAPANIFDAGWYKDSSRPGEPGAMVIDGHVSGPTKPGIFKNLGEMAKGDKIEIERGDGETFTYTVQATKVFDAEELDMSSVMVPIVPGKPGLNIITCAGKFDKATNKYEQRTVVYAVIN